MEVETVLIQGFEMLRGTNNTLLGVQTSPQFHSVLHETAQAFPKILPDNIFLV